MRGRGKSFAVPLACAVLSGGAPRADATWPSAEETVIRLPPMGVYEPLLVPGTSKQEIEK